jgi:hypothetical protein
MADSHNLTLPEWLTLAQAAEWLTERTHVVGMKWTADTLLATLCTSVGPLSEVHTILPLWLALPGTGFRVWGPSAVQAVGLDETPFIPVTHGTVLLLHVRASIEFNEARVRFDGDKTGRFDAGTNSATAVSRDWLTLRGFDLLMFLCAYMDVQTAVQARHHAPAPDAETREPSCDKSVPSVKPEEGLRVVRHHMKSRRDGLSPLIERAMQAANGPDDYHGGWTRFVAFAHDKVSPLLEYVREDKKESVKYMDGGDVEFLTKDAFRKRVKRGAAR